jgi:hypothetical protein
LSDYETVLVDITTKSAKAESSTKTWFDRLKDGIGYLISNTPALGPALKALGFLNDKVKEQADYLRRLQQPTSNVTKRQVELTTATIAKTASIKNSTTATDKASAAAKAHAEWLAKSKESMAKLKQETQDLADALHDSLNVKLDDAVQKLKDAQTAFDDFGKGVGAAITGSFNFGDAQSTATENANNLQSALAKQAEAQKKVNDAQSDFDFYQTRDTLKVLNTSLGDLKVATDEVTAAQAKPATFFENLTKQAQKAKDFGVLVNRLIAAGLSETALSQVLAAGVDGGTAIATEILGSADGVLKANTLTQSMTDLADEMGTRAASKYYGAGVTAATEFLKGMQETIKKVEVVLANPNLTTSDVIGASVSAGTINMADFQSQLTSDLQGINFGMGTMMADGGIVRKSTTITAGESGPEAIIPLDRLGSIGMGGGNNVTINVNGGDPNAVVLALQKYIRTNGPVPITTRPM